VAYGSDAVRLFDPWVSQWTYPPAGGYLRQSRFGHSAILVGTKVLIAGGSHYGALSSTELWDPATQRSSSAGAMTMPRTEPVAVLDNLGVPVVHSSGWYGNASSSTGVDYAGGTTDRWNAATNTWSAGPTLPNGGSFLFARTITMTSGLTMSFGVNSSAAFLPNAVATLGRACPSPLPAATTCMTAGTCDGSGNYTPPAPITDACCLNGVPRPSGTLCTSTPACAAQAVCSRTGACLCTTSFEDLTTDGNRDGVMDGLGAQLGFLPNEADTDRDGISNADELRAGTNPLRADSDGDGVPDNLDPFPLDPRISSLPALPQDVTPPVITLTAPSYAVAQ
jgi:hypothetical protein